MLKAVGIWLVLVFTAAVPLSLEHHDVRSQNGYAHATKRGPAGIIVLANGERRDLAAGDAFYIAPHLNHRRVGLEAGVLLDGSGPARADFPARDI